MKLKRLSGQDDVPVRKLYKDGITVRLFSRITYVTNDLPYFPDSARALRRRVLLLEFPNSYEANPDYTLKNRIPLEAQGFCNWAIEGLKRLLDVGRFTAPDICIDALNDLKMMTSPIAGMVDDCCQFGSDLRTDCQMMYDLHKAWFTENGYHILTPPAFGRQFRNTHPDVKKARTRNIDGSRPYFYQGVGITKVAKLKYLG